MAIEDAIFRRSELLLGDEAMERIAQKRVIIFGFMLAGLVIQNESRVFLKD